MTINYLCCNGKAEKGKSTTFFENLATKAFGLTIMDIRGYRRLRTIVQLFFETFPQILLQVRILLSDQANELHIDIWELVISLTIAILHASIELLILYSGTFKFTTQQVCTIRC